MRYGVILALAVITAALALGPAPGAQALSWSTTTVDADPDTGFDSSVGVDSNGDVMISYNIIVLNDLRFAICDRSLSANGNCNQAADWSTGTIEAPGIVGEFSSIAVDGNGDPLLSYSKGIGGADSQLKYAICDRSASTNGNCNLAGDWSTVRVDGAVVSGDGIFAGSWTSIAVDATGDPMVSYQQDGIHLRFAICERSLSTNGNCNQTGDWTTVTVDSEMVGLGSGTSIALDGNGDPMIAYGHEGAHGIKFAICDRSASTNGKCDQAADWSKVTVTLDTGFGLTQKSLAVDGNGDPMITYPTSTGELTFAICDRSASANGNCDQAADWDSVTLAPGGGTGEIATTSNGDPVIAYGGVKLAICDRSASAFGDCTLGGDWYLETVDPTPAGSGSIDVDGSGNIMISYRGSLKFATVQLGANASDFDDDGVHNVDEGPCGADPLDPGQQPERLDTPGDDDGDTVANEGLPSPASDAFDCDGDGWRGNQENLIYGDAPSTARDQDPCGSNGWASDLAGGNNILNIADINSFLASARPDDGHGTFNKFSHPLDDTTPVPDGTIDAAMARWNLQLPPHFSTVPINIGDLNALITGAVGSPARPPMFGGQPAFFTNGGMCPWAP